MSKTRGNKPINELTTEELIAKVCSEFTDKVQKSFNMRFDELDKKLNSINGTLTNIKNSVQNNQEAIVVADEKIERLEQSIKENSLRIYGLVEEEEGVSVLEHVIEFFNSQLKVNCCIEDFDCVMRINRRDDNENKPRVVIVKFLSNVKKTQVFSAKTELKNNGVSIFEDLTKKNFALLTMAKNKFGKKHAWSQGGKFYFHNEKDRKRCSVNCEGDIQSH
ncbi:unnamed protein product [Phaedon cochleariae]|uniref:Uncharacterized protein n=1 Tax=Phaedon cochleariae TaxID=80249 RepID=A0A9P0DKQ5_PHACE|nr:unnamed protein product [Phaedon cochleariae]